MNNMKPTEHIEVMVTSNVPFLIGLDILDKYQKTIKNGRCPGVPNLR